MRSFYVWFANRHRVTCRIELEFMQPGQPEVANAYASDVTRLLSFRDTRGLAIVYRPTAGSRDLRDLRASNRLSYASVFSQELLSSSTHPSLSPLLPVSPPSFLRQPLIDSHAETLLSRWRLLVNFTGVSTPARNDSNDGGGWSVSDSAVKWLNEIAPPVTTIII